MPAYSPTGNQTVQLANTIFAKGYVYLSDDGGNFADNYPVGQVENVQLRWRTQFESAMGPDSLYPVAVAAASRELTITGTNLKVRMNQIRKMLGGTQSVATNTSLLGAGADTPLCFQMHLFSGVDTSTGGGGTGTPDAEIKIWRVYAEDLGIDFSLRKFVRPNWTARAVADANGNVFTIILPGDQTAS